MISQHMNRFLGIITIGIFLTANLFGVRFMMPYSPMSISSASHESHAGEACQHQADCAPSHEKSIECISFCLNTAPPIQTTPLSFVIAFTLFIFFVFGIAVPQKRAVFLQQNQFKDPPHYLFNTVMLRE